MPGAIAWQADWHGLYGSKTHLAQRTDIGDDTHAAARGIESIVDATIELPRHYIEIEGSLVQRVLRTLKLGSADYTISMFGFDFR